jgi:hypothetical protein
LLDHPAQARDIPGRAGLTRRWRNERVDIKIDAFNHFIPPAYLELLKAHSKDCSGNGRKSGRF